MLGNVSLSRNQERFLQALSAGQSIVDAAKSVGVTEQTAHRWLKDPLVQAEKERRETVLAESEQAEITRIMTSGYAAIHNRVRALDSMARVIEESLVDPTTKIINPKWLYPDKLREWRGMLDDIAKELGQRVKKQEVEHSWAETLDSEYDSLLSDLRGLADNASEKQASIEPPESHSA